MRLLQSPGYSCFWAAAKSRAVWGGWWMVGDFHWWRVNISPNKSNKFSHHHQNPENYQIRIHGLRALELQKLPFVNFRFFIDTRNNELARHVLDNYQWVFTADELMR
jgi:hypothetical protein